ncbi:MAG: FMN-binding negative transcriptional regulator [Bacteroidota bacterium]
MYIPNLYREDDRKFLKSFMRQFSFATLITSENETPIATHLPFVIEERDEKIILTTHMAELNPQWKSFKNRTLVIFQEPHGYVSPTLYEKKVNVPTWNYIAVHAYGIPKILEGNALKIEVLQKMFQSYEAAFKTQWEELPEKYKSALLQEIVAFEIEVTEIQGKQKLSQNKTFKERENIINNFEKSGDGAAKSLAGFMKNYPFKK